MLAPVTEADLEAVERMLVATLGHCHTLRSQQRHQGARLSAAGALRLIRTMQETQAHHGFFADLITRPFQGRFEEFL